MMKNKTFMRSLLCVIFFTLLMVVFGLLITKVKINYDVTKYLPVDTMTKESMNIYEEEFGMNGTLLVMIKADNPDKEYKNRIKGILNTSEVMNIEERQNEENILFIITLKEDDYSEKTQKYIKDVSSSLDGEYEYYMFGQSFVSYNYNEMIKKEIPKIILFLLPIVLLILFLTSSSFIEPLLFVIIVACSVIINMGSNVFLSDVSYMTNAIGGILQFALCMDYSIIFLTNYQNLKQKGEKDYLKKACKSSLIPILSASLTTVAGFIAIMMMKYRIGLDIGLVLAKGVVITLITVITLMPCLTVLFDKVIDKTKHRNLIKVSTGFKNFLLKTRYVLPIIVLVIMGLGLYFQSKNEFIYSDNAFSNEGEELQKNTKAIEEAFGKRNNVVILIDKEINTEDLENKIYNLNNDVFNSFLSYDKKFTLEELLNMTNNEISFNNETKEFITTFFGEKISIREYSELIKKLKMSLPKEEMKDVLQMMFKINEEEIQMLNIVYDGNKSIIELLTDNSELINTSYTASEMSNILGLEEIIVTNYYELLNLDKVSIIKLTNFLLAKHDIDTMKKLLVDIDENQINMIYNTLGSDKLTCEEVLRFILENYGSYIPDKKPLEEELNLLVYYQKYTKIMTMINTITPIIIASSNITIEDNFLSDNYQRIILELNLSEENEESFTYFNDLNTLLDESFLTYYTISSTNTVMDIKAASKNDYLFVTIISVLLIYIITFFAFRSFTIPLILIILIEGAIFINMGIPAVLGEKILYIGYIIVGCIQLGATIDYGILLTNKYVTLRKEHDKKESMFLALDESTSSIITSGFILTCCGLMLGVISSVPVISMLGRLIGFGALFSMFIVITILPQILYNMDKVIIKQKNKLENFYSKKR